MKLKKMDQAYSEVEDEGLRQLSLRVKVSVWVRVSINMILGDRIRQRMNVIVRINEYRDIVGLSLFHVHSQGLGERQVQVREKIRSRDRVSVWAKVSIRKV